jgi:hypothetical protein
MNLLSDDLLTEQVLNYAGLPAYPALAPPWPILEIHLKKIKM